MAQFNTRRVPRRRISAFFDDSPENPAAYDVQGNPANSEMALMAGYKQMLIDEWEGSGGPPRIVMPIFEFYD